LNIISPTAAGSSRAGVSAIFLARRTALLVDGGGLDVIWPPDFSPHLDEPQRPMFPPKIKLGENHSFGAQNWLVCSGVIMAVRFGHLAAVAHDVRIAAVKLASAASMRRNNIPYADFFCWEIRWSKNKTSVIDRVCSGAGIFLKCNAFGWW
jgi:hypothetical protein